MSDIYTYDENWDSRLDNTMDNKPQIDYLTKKENVIKMYDIKNKEDRPNEEKRTTHLVSTSSL